MSITIPNTFANRSVSVELSKLDENFAYLGTKVEELTPVVSDGDKGDITVSETGTVWTIDDGVVNTSKLGGDITAAGKALLDDADAAAQRVTLGLGSLATQSGTFSGTNTGDQNLFSTIAVAGQSNVVADTTTDTLTLVAGTNMAITTDATTDTVTVTAPLTHYVENAYLINYTNLGVVPTTITLDINKKWNIGEFIGGDTTYTVNAISPTVSTLEPAHFTFVNNGSIIKTLVFNSSIISITGSFVNQVIVPIGYKVDFEIRRNPLNVGASYEAKLGTVNYNQTASGLDTTWNPSDYSRTNPGITLSNSNKTVTMQLGGGPNGARAFGQKTSGRWLFAIRCEISIGGDDDADSVVGIGIATPGTPLNIHVGRTVNTGSIYILDQGISEYFTTYDENVATYQLSTLRVRRPDILCIAFDADTGKGFVNYNNTWLFNGNPETGANPIFTLPEGNLYLPMISFSKGFFVGYSVGTWSILNALDVGGVLATVPSYQYWTA